MGCALTRLEEIIMPRTTGVKHHPESQNIIILDWVDFPLPQGELQSFQANSYKDALDLALTHSRPGVIVVYDSDSHMVWVKDLNNSGQPIHHPGRISFKFVGLSQENQPGYYPPGNQPVYYPSGNQPVNYPQGNQPGYYPPGNQPGYYPPGNQPVNYRPGNQPVYYPPGNQPGYYPPGNQPVNYRPGNQPAYYPPGNQPVNNPQGNQPAYYPPGNQPVNNPRSNQPVHQQPRKPIYMPSILVTTSVISHCEQRKITIPGRWSEREWQGWPWEGRWVM
jgi:hypothetical protein